MQFSTPIMWSKLFFILWLIHSTIARPQDLLDTTPFFFPENQLGQSSGTSTQLKSSGDTSSDSNHENAQQEQWTEDPKPIFLAGAGCNDADAAPNQVLYSRSRRTFTRRGGGEICIPDDRTQSFKQPEEAQPPETAGAAQPLPLDPTSGKPKRPGKRKKPAKGIGGDALPMYNAIYNFPGEDGKPDYEVCNISEYPLLRVPICAPPQPYSPISMVLPARFWQSSAPCAKVIGETLWCCLTARQAFHELASISDGPPPPIIQAYPVVGFTCAIVLV